MSWSNLITFSKYNKLRLARQILGNPFINSISFHSQTGYTANIQLLRNEVDFTESKKFPEVSKTTVVILAVTLDVEHFFVIRSYPLFDFKFPRAFFFNLVQVSSNATPRHTCCRFILRCGLKATYITCPHLPPIRRMAFRRRCIDTIRY